MRSPAKILSIAAVACAALAHGGLAFGGTLMDATFTDGTTVTGSFKLNVYGYLDDPSLSITTHAFGSFTGATYTFGGIIGSPPTNGIDLTVGTDNASFRELHIVFQHLLNASAFDAIDLGASWECQSFACLSGPEVRYFASGASVPEPAAWLLMLLGGAALWSRKERQSGQAIPV